MVAPAVRMFQCKRAKVKAKLPGSPQKLRKTSLKIRLTFLIMLVTKNPDVENTTFLNTCCVAQFIKLAKDGI